MYIELNANLALTQADEQDLGQCLEIIELVSDGMLAFLLEPLEVKSALALVSGKLSMFSQDNMYVLKQHGSPEVKALLFAYKNHYHKLPAIVSTLMSRNKFDLLRRVIQPRTQDSFYINTLYVDPELRNLGLATLLLDVAKILAGEQGCQDICLHSFNDHQWALNLYMSCGYQLVDHVDYFGELAVQHPKGGSILSLPLTAAA